MRYPSISHHPFDFPPSICPCCNPPANFSVRIAIHTYHSTQLYKIVSLLKLLPISKHTLNLCLLKISPPLQLFLESCFSASPPTITARSSVYNFSTHYHCQVFCVQLLHPLALPGRLCTTSPPTTTATARSSVYNFSIHYHCQVVCVQLLHPLSLPGHLCTTSPPTTTARSSVYNFSTHYHCQVICVQLLHPLPLPGLLCTTSPPTSTARSSVYNFSTH